MADWLQTAGDRTATVVAAMGRASTPPVKDRGRSVQAFPAAWPDHNRWPVLVVGAAPELLDAGIDVWAAHPNQLEAHSTSPERFRALVVDARHLGGQWAGALSGASQWKSEVVYQALAAWRGAGFPAYLIKPDSETVPSYRWASAATAIFPWTGDDAEDTGNPSTQLWRAMEKVGGRQ